MEPVLQIQGLKTRFTTKRGMLTAVDGVSLHVNQGETLGVVGESGCGKSVTALSVLQLLPRPLAHIAEGKILFKGQDLVKAKESVIRGIRGNQISMIFQEPMTSLNPVYTVGYQIMEPLKQHRGMKKDKARQEAVQLLELVGIPEPTARIDDYPHQLSGGMRQRVMIAMALACRPAVMIADEPTTALDVTIQAQILELMKKLQQEIGMARLLITHDLGVVAETCHRVVVMYAGKIVESADVEELFIRPGHPIPTGCSTHCHNGGIYRGVADHSWSRTKPAKSASGVWFSGPVRICRQTVQPDSSLAGSLRRPWRALLASARG